MRLEKLEKQLEIGESVIFYDEYAKPHEALVTNIWGERELVVMENDKEIQQNLGKKRRTNEPGCNLLFVSSDEKKEDDYGRQIERQSSCIHVSGQAAPGYAWSWPSERGATLKRFREERQELHKKKVEKM